MRTICTSRASPLATSCFCSPPLRHPSLPPVRSRSALHCTHTAAADPHQQRPDYDLHCDVEDRLHALVELHCQSHSHSTHTHATAAHHEMESTGHGTLADRRHTTSETTRGRREEQREVWRQRRRQRLREEERRDTRKTEGETERRSKKSRGLWAADRCPPALLVRSPCLLTTMTPPRPAQTPSWTEAAHLAAASVCTHTHTHIYIYTHTHTHTHTHNTGCRRRSGLEVSVHSRRAHTSEQRGEVKCGRTGGRIAGWAVTACVCGVCVCPLTAYWPGRRVVGCVAHPIVSVAASERHHGPPPAMCLLPSHLSHDWT